MDPLKLSVFIFNILSDVRHVTVSIHVVRTRVVYFEWLVPHLSLVPQCFFEIRISNFKNKVIQFLMWCVRKPIDCEVLHYPQTICVLIHQYLLISYLSKKTTSQYEITFHSYKLLRCNHSIQCSSSVQTCSYPMRQKSGIYLSNS